MRRRVNNIKSRKAADGKAKVNTHAKRATALCSIYIMNARKMRDVIRMKIERKVMRLSFSSFLYVPHCWQDSLFFFSSPSERRGTFIAYLTVPMSTT